LSRKISAAIVVFLSLSAGHCAYAQDAGPRVSDTVVNERVQERINFIQASFDKNQSSARMWSYSWIGIQGALTGVQAVQAAASGHNRVSSIVGASESFLGLAVMVIDPFHARSSGSDLRKIPEGTPDEQKRKLEIAESWLERNAKQEQLGRSWVSHLLGIAVGAIGGGIIWHNNGSKNGIANAVATVAFSEVQIWTQPVGGVRDYKNYHDKYKSAEDRGIRKNYFISAGPNGIVAGFYF
jgi:hypothetical protein